MRHATGDLHRAAPTAACIGSLIYLMAPPRKVWTAAEEANHRASRVAAARQRRAQQTAVQRVAQTAACCRRRADSSVRF